jgi:hypothetical protein
MVGRFVMHATGRFFLLVPGAAGTSGVLVGAAGPRVDAEVPGDPAARVRAGLQRGKDGVPGAVTLQTEPIRIRHGIRSMSCRLIPFGARPMTGAAGSNGSSGPH